MAAGDPGGADGRELLEFVAGMTDAARLQIEENLPHGFVRLKIAEAEFRQAKHDIRCVEDIVVELLRNSRDAGATRILVATSKSGGRYRSLHVIDDGCGIHPDMHRAVFEPRVTTKRGKVEEDRFGIHGRGMALFSIKTRARSATIESSLPGKGTVVSVLVDTESIPERADQASLPAVSAEGDELAIGPGPHNMLRKALEISIDHRAADIYVGSCSEVLATLYRMSVDDPADLQTPWSDIRNTVEAKELVSYSERRLGISVSERNAYRVMNREVAPLQTVLERALELSGNRETLVGPDSPPGVASEGGKDRARRRNPVKNIAVQDLEEIKRELSGPLQRVLSRYYLHTSGEPVVKRGRGRITISFYVTGEEEE